MEPDRDCCLRVCRSTQPIYESSKAPAGDLLLSQRTALTTAPCPPKSTALIRSVS